MHYTKLWMHMYQLHLLSLSNFWVLKAKSRDLLSEEWLSLITWPQFNQWKSIHSQWRSFFLCYLSTILASWLQINNSDSKQLQRKGYSHILLGQFNVQQIFIPHIHPHEKSFDLRVFFKIFVRAVFEVAEVKSIWD